MAQRPQRTNRLLALELPADTDPEQLARLARLRWKIELDYKQLKGELGLTTEGRSWLGGITTPLVTAAHGFRPWSGSTQITSGRLTLPQAVQLLQPLFKCCTAAVRPANNRSTSSSSSYRTDDE